jgi:hypothetical protein
METNGFEIKRKQGIIFNTNHFLPNFNHGTILKAFGIQQKPLVRNSR